VAIENCSSRILHDPGSPAESNRAGSLLFVRFVAQTPNQAGAPAGSPDAASRARFAYLSRPTLW